MDNFHCNIEKNGFGKQFVCVCVGGVQYIYSNVYTYLYEYISKTFLLQSRNKIISLSYLKNHFTHILENNQL